MGKLISSILLCCVKNEEKEQESNPTQRLVDENNTRPSYTTEAEKSVEPQVIPSAYSENSTASTTSVYYTPSSSYRDTPVTSTELESNGVTSWGTILRRLIGLRDFKCDYCRSCYCDENSNMTAGTFSWISQHYHRVCRMTSWNHLLNSLTSLCASSTQKPCITRRVMI